MNIWSRFQALFPDPPLLVGTVQAHMADGSSRIVLPSGAVIYASGTGVAEGSKAFVRGGKVEGEAPELPAIQIEV